MFAAGSAQTGGIEEGWREKQRQRSSRLFGGQTFFGSVPFFQTDRGKTASAARNCSKSALQTDKTTFTFASLFILLLSCGRRWRNRKNALNLDLNPDEIRNAKPPWLKNKVQVTSISPSTFFSYYPPPLLGQGG